VSSYHSSKAANQYRVIYMTKKDYEAIADDIRHTRECGGDMATLNTLVEMLCKTLARDNAKFNADTFRRWSSV
jgi:hypothetical protein